MGCTSSLETLFQERKDCVTSPSPQIHTLQVLCPRLLGCSTPEGLRLCAERAPMALARPKSVISKRNPVTCLLCPDGANLQPAQVQSPLLYRRGPAGFCSSNSSCDLRIVLKIRLQATSTNWLELAKNHSLKSCPVSAHNRPGRVTGHPELNSPQERGEFFALTERDSQRQVNNHQLH